MDMNPVCKYHIISKEIIDSDDHYFQDLSSENPIKVLELCSKQVRLSLNRMKLLRNLTLIGSECRLNVSL